MLAGQRLPQAAALSQQTCSTGRRLVHPFTSAAPNSRGWRLQVQASKGFEQKAPAKKSAGQKGQKPQKQKKSNLERYLDLEVPQEEAGTGWTRAASLQDFVSKPLKPVILETGQAIVVYKVGDAVYCTDASSTAFQFPLADATILQTKTGPAVEVPLDGTTYDLATGKVLSWCPKNTPIRQVLGSLKDKSEPVDLKVYPTEMRGEDIYVRFT